jgi:hypothetical protein
MKSGGMDVSGETDVSGGNKPTQPLNPERVE